MTEARLHGALVLGVAVMAVFTCLFLLRFAAPYGHHDPGRGWGPRIGSRWGWVLMECPAVLAYGAVLVVGDRTLATVPLVFSAAWLTHYVHRALVFPLRLSGNRAKSVPLVIVGSGAAFNVLNAYVNARWVSHLADYPVDWLRDPRFLLGAVVFAGGMILNLWADGVLLSLRRASGPVGKSRPADPSGPAKNAQSGYRIPRGGAFRYVSCPNYLGEIVQWGGWALATWSTAGAAFFLFTAANLRPRALSHHRWYRETFEEYPPERKALIPKVL